MASIRKIEGKGGVSYKITVTMGADYAGYVYSMMEQRGDSPHSLWRFERLSKRIAKESSFGNMKLKDVRPQHINEYYKSLTKQGSGSYTARQVVDFNTVVGDETRARFARKHGLSIPTIRRLCKGANTSPETAQQIETALNRKGLFEIVRRSGKPLSYKTMVIIHSVVSVVFAWAEKEMIIPYNPAKKATLPVKKDGKEADCLQPEELEQVMDTLQAEDIDKRFMVMLFIVTGCRKGGDYRVWQLHARLIKNEGWSGGGQGSKVRKAYWPSQKIFCCLQQGNSCGQTGQIYTRHSLFYGRSH